MRRRNVLIRRACRVSCFNVAAKHAYLFRARRAEGPWERFIINELLYDHSLRPSTTSQSAADTRKIFEKSLSSGGGGCI